MYTYYFREVSIIRRPTTTASIQTFANEGNIGINDKIPNI